MKTFTSIILIVAAVVLFIFFTRPKFAELKASQIEVQALNTANDNAKTLNEKIEKLLNIKKEITADDLMKMEKMLPNNVENVKLIIDFDKMLQALVEERGTLRLYQSNEVTDTGAKKISIESPKITPGTIADTSFDTSRLGVVNFTFAVTLTYADFLEFMQRIEHSTRILDVESVTFSSATTGGVASASREPIYTFSVSLRTYWLKYIGDNKLK